MSEYYYLFDIYSFFNNKTITYVRIGIFVFLLLLLSLSFQNHLVFKILLVLLSFFILNEIFLIFKVFRAQPPLTVARAKEASEELMTLSTLFLYEYASSGYGLALLLSHVVSVRFFIEKIGPQFFLYQSSIEKEDVLKKAFLVAGETNGDYVREIDLFIAYLLLTEDKSKLIEKSDLDKEDFIYILNWTRNRFFPKKGSGLEFVYSGSGTFDFFIFGWSVETKKYAVDLTSAVISSKFPPTIIGRQKEYQRMLTVLGKNNANNVILVGEPGVGKTSLVQYFTYESHLGQLPGRLAYRKVYELFVDRLMAGANSQGELEQRLYDLFLDIRYSGEVIIFIQNIENVFGQGGFHFDISGAMFQYLESSALQVIGTANSSAYKLHLENKEYIGKFFDVIKLEEPNESDALLMVSEKTAHLEQQYGISFTYNALKSAIELSSSYIPDRLLPGKAINLLEDVASEAHIRGKNIIDKEDLVQKLEEKTKIVLSTPTEEEKTILLHLEDEIHKRIIDQEEAVSAISRAIRRLRSGFINKKRPIGVFLFLGPTGVGKTETAKALSALYFGEEKNMIRVDMSEYQTEDSIKRFLGSLPGEEYLPSEFVEQVKARPFSLVLLDEFEKAHPRILDVFLQVFEDGRLTDNLGRTVSFINTIIIATSNAGSELIREHLSQGHNIQDIKKEILDTLLKKEVFRPELLNRFDEVVLFKPLGVTEIRKVSKLILSSVLKLQEEKHIFITYDDKVIEKVVNEGFNIEFGARNVRRYIETHIADYLSRLILEGKIVRGAHVVLTIDEQGNIIVK